MGYIGARVPETEFISKFVNVVRALVSNAGEKRKGHTEEWQVMDVRRGD
jgi:hypothetical protein